MLLHVVYIQYGSLEDVMKDVELLVSNATTFNEEDSTVYQVEKISSSSPMYTYFFFSPSSRML